MAGKHGGKRAGAGRKRIDPTLKVRHIRLTDAQVKLLCMWGKGDMSAGLRWLINSAAPIVYKKKGQS